MTSSVTLLLLSFHLAVSMSSQSYPPVILFMCFKKSDSEVFFVIIPEDFSSLWMYLISISLYPIMSLTKCWQISMYLVRIPTCPFFSRKIALWLSSYTTEGLCNPVIYSSNILTNLTSCAHADSTTYYAYVMLNVTVLWVFEKHIRSVPTSVATRLLKNFLYPCIWHN